jgi:TusE/DsrC/DsvC family sulfur relay protein
LDQPDEASRPAGTGPLQVQVRSLAGREVVFDSEGFLADSLQWTEEVARVLAQESGLAVLADTHWQVIRFLREYYLQNGRAPLNRQLKAGLGMSLMEIESLFPGGLKLGARRLAGLPNPKTCG